jgi:hypothetical protein
MSAQIFYNNGSSSSEIITHLVNASDGAGLHFDGTSGKLSNTSAPDLGSQWSIELIIQADAFGSANVNIADWSNTERIYIGAHSATGYKLGIFRGTGFVSFGVETLEDLKVHHIVIAVDETANTATLFDNGNQVASITPNGSNNVDDNTVFRLCADDGGTANFFNGTLYRARLWNRKLESTDVTSVYESASIDYADQWGRQAVTGGDFATSSDWTTQTGGWAVSGGKANFTDGGGTGGLGQTCFTSADAGKQVSLTFTVGTGAALLWIGNLGTQEYVSGGYNTYAIGTHTVTFTLPSGQTALGFYSSNSAAGNFDIDNVSAHVEGCVADFDLAFANPTQSTIVQDRAGVADGTAAGGVSQISPIEQLNTKSLSVGTSAVTPADGQIIVGNGLKVNAGTLQLDDVAESIDFLQSGAINFDSNGDQTGRTLTIGSNRAGGASGGTTNLVLTEDGNVGVGVTPVSGSGIARFLHIGGSTAGIVLEDTDGPNKWEQYSAGGNLKWEYNGGSSALEIDSNGDVSVKGGGELRTYRSGDSAYGSVYMTADETVNFYNSYGSGKTMLFSREGKLTVPNGIVETNGVLKSNELSNSGFDCWSNSTFENTGSDLIDNGDFASASDWGVSTGAWVIGSGVATFTTGSGTSILSQGSLGTTSGKLYKLTFTVGTATATIAITNASASGTLVAEADYAVGAHTVVYEDVGNNDIAFTSSGGNSYTLDNVSLHEGVPGCVAADALAMDGWAKRSAIDIWRQHDDATYTKDGSFYSLKGTSSTDGYQVLWPVSGSNSVEHIAKFNGRTVTFGAWVYSTLTTPEVRLNILADGATHFSTQTVSQNTWTWLEVTHSVTTSNTQVYFSIEKSSTTAETYYISQPMVVFGSAIGAGNYSRPSGEIVNLEADIDLVSNESPLASDDKVLNLEALSLGKIPKGAKSVNLSVLVLNSSVSNYQGVRYGKDTNGMYLQCLPIVNDMYAAATGVVKCDSNGDIYQTVTETDATLSGLYLHITQIQLR